VSITNSDIIITDATIIIGLLVLLTFSSVSSPFVESETSVFFEKWYDLKNNIKTNNELLIQCTDLKRAEKNLNNNVNDTALYDKFTDKLMTKFTKSNQFQSNERGIIKGVGDDPVTSVDDKVKEKMIDRCSELIVNGNELITKLDVLNEWGHSFKYLKMNDKNEYFESDSFKERASGPFTINMINLAMMFPFLISAIFVSVFSSRHRNDGEPGTSKGGLVFMTAGMVMLLVGLTIIGGYFYNAASPFLN
jgi:hypothetical protein